MRKQIKNLGTLAVLAVLVGILVVTATVVGAAADPNSTENLIKDAEREIRQQKEFAQTPEGRKFYREREQRVRELLWSERERPVRESDPTGGARGHREPTHVKIEPSVNVRGFTDYDIWASRGANYCRASVSSDFDGHGVPYTEAKVVVNGRIWRFEQPARTAAEAQQRAYQWRDHYNKECQRMVRELSRADRERSSSRETQSQGSTREHGSWMVGRSKSNI